MQAVLALEDGTTFSGSGFGAPGIRAGEVVFNTAMTGYQELLTDPSCMEKILLLTMPHVGNTGVNLQDNESTAAHAAGLVIRDLPRRHSSWRATTSLPQWMREQGLPGMADVDTRALATLLREKGRLKGCLMVGEAVDAEEALRRARAFEPTDMDGLTARIDRRETSAWTEGNEAASAPEQAVDRQSPHVVCVDYGIKQGILRTLVDQGCRVTVVPSTLSMDELLALDPDGVLLSNGPGHPQEHEAGIRLAAGLIEHRIPVFGICLGHQLLSLAAGARVERMKLGHHGANHPVKALASGRVYISSQNHGYAVDESSLPEGVEASHRSLFDGTLQGIRFVDRPVMGFQGHPEASPGPHDLRLLFTEFLAMMAAAR